MLRKHQSSKKYEATIHYINPSIGKERATKSHCHISGYGNELLPGMFMNSEIKIKKVAANTLPEEAVVKWNNSQYIFLEAGTIPIKCTRQKRASFKTVLLK